MLGKQTIRATVIGAGCYSTQLSGSTVFYQNVTLPLKNLPVAVFDRQQQEDPDYMRRRLQREDGDTVVIAIPGIVLMKRIRMNLFYPCHLVMRQFCCIDQP